MAHHAAWKNDEKYFESSFGDHSQSRPKGIISRIFGSSRKSSLDSHHSNTNIVVQHTGFNKHGFAPIHSAAFANSHRVLRVLLEINPIYANQPAINYPHTSLPLNLAIVGGSVQGVHVVECVRVLMKHGANPYLRDGDGLDAWETARRIGKSRILKALRKYDLKYNNNTSHGECYLIEGGVSFKKKQMFNSSDNITIITGNIDDMRTKSDSELYLIPSASNYNHHTLGPIPKGPWDVDINWGEKETSTSSLVVMTRDHDTNDMQESLSRSTSLASSIASTASQSNKSDPG